MNSNFITILPIQGIPEVNQGDNLGELLLSALEMEDLTLESGDIIWVTEASIYAGIAADDNAIFVSEADGTVMALSRFTGREIWKKENLLYRNPTAPVIMGDSIVIGDLEGYLHWLDKTSGETQERINIGKSKISNVPLVLNNSIYVLTDSGDLVSVEKKIPTS